VDLRSDQASKTRSGRVRRARRWSIGASHRMLWSRILLGSARARFGALITLTGTSSRVSTRGKGT
jgi:hypothetical protein